VSVQEAHQDCLSKLDKCTSELNEALESLLLANSQNGEFYCQVQTNLIERLVEKVTSLESQIHLKEVELDNTVQNHKRIESQLLTSINSFQSEIISLTESLKLSQAEVSHTNEVVTVISN
jgi:hypothetical protein